MKPKLPIYKLFFDKNFLNRISKPDKQHFLTQSTHFAYYTKQGESFILTSSNRTKQITLLNEIVILKTYKISDFNILKQPSTQYLNTPGYILDEILDFEKIKIFFEKNPDNIIQNIEDYLYQYEPSILELIKQIKKNEGLLVIDKNTKHLQSAYNFKKLK